MASAALVAASFSCFAAEPDLAAVRAQADALRHEVTLLEDENAVENLQNIYGFYVDKAQWEQVADLFADNATLEIGGRGVFVGKARILEYMRWLAPKGQPPGLLFNHLQMQPLIHVAPDGKTAKARLNFMAEVGQQGTPEGGRWGFGVYENEYVKEDGVWKIAKLHSYFTLYTSYDEGWAKSAVPNTRPEQDLPPDRPPTLVYDTYPAVMVPPFHYPHPVTGR
jgi:hypothetical protein